MSECCVVVSRVAAARTVKRLLQASVRPSEARRSLPKVNDTCELLDPEATSYVAELLSVSPEEERLFLDAIKQAGYTSPVAGVEPVVKTKLQQCRDDGWRSYWLELKRTQPVVEYL